MSLCPSCGREVGSSVTCPYCGANLKRRLTLAVFGLLAIVLAAGGLALLYIVSITTTIPTIRIGEIQATMNYAYVRIEGVVKRSPNYNPDSQSLTFQVDDGSGQMLVAAFRAEARALIEADRVPSIGDRVSVEGVLRVRDEAPSLTINSPDSLALTHAIDSAAARDLGSISAADVLSGVSVRGQVRAVREPSSGLRLITIRDQTGEMDVVVDREMESFDAPAPDVQISDSVRVTGVVTLFEGEPQVTLTRADQLSVLSEPVEIAELTPIRELDDGDIGRWVRVQGTIAKVTTFSTGVKFILNDPQRRGVTLLVWNDVLGSLPDVADWQIGADVAAQGLVSSFRGELEIVPELPLDVAILTRAVAASPATLGLTPLGTITQADIGRTMFISGTIESVERLADGVRFRLGDDTGSIRLLLLTGVYEQVENADRLDEGVSVSALGRVNESDGELEVVPPNGASVRVAPVPEVAQITPTPEPAATATSRPTPAARGTATVTPSAGGLATPEATPPARPTATLSDIVSIASIDASRIGQSVSVRGQVLATSSFSAGFRFTLNDGSGSVQLVLFDGRYREVSDRAALNLGAQVRVKALVAEFNGALELQPEVGADVIIEQPGSPSIVKTRGINTLAASDIGTLVAIVGDVLRVEGFSAGVAVFVNDGTGELRVVIFNNVLAFVPNATALQAGAKVHVVGRLDEFSGALELVPALGYDVTVNP
ncbi:MAG TPA: OB-fold nucleic acid binding domain-containing protein [Anaerolineae bacterium]